MAQQEVKRLAILASGGPAPGINSVIHAATIEATNLGWEVLGVRDGFLGLVEDRLKPLGLDDVAFILFDGGCVLGMSRTNPRDHLDAIVATLRRQGVTMLMTIGGDDTAFGARVIAEAMDGELRTVHVPKTIDNDLPLPYGVPTFGFTTARQVGAELVKNLMKDARTCRRWFVAVSMGRQAGHLALGIARASGAQVAVIPEEFGDRMTTLGEVAAILEGAVLKGLAHGRGWGVAVVAEGVIERLDREDLQAFPGLRRDPFGHILLSEIRLGEWLARELTARMKQRAPASGVRFNEVQLGYELRCADPVAYDIEYTQELGFGAVRMLAEGGSDAMVMIVGGKRQTLSFDELRDPSTGRTRVRNVDTTTESYLVARRAMQRLTRKDFDDDADVARLADASHTTPARFREDFEWLVRDEPARFGWEDHVRDAMPER